MGTTHDDTLEAIRRVVDEAQQLQNDVEGFTDLLAEDVVIVNFGGRRVRGRSAVREAMTAALATPLADVATTHEIEQIRFLRPDVAVVDCVKHVHDNRTPPAGAADDEPPLRRRGALTFVLVEEDGRWRVAVAHTTPVAA